MSFTPTERRLLALLAIAQFSHIVDFMILMPLGPQLMRTLAIDPHEYGLLVSIYTLSAALAGFLSAGVMDRFDRKRAFQVVYLGFAVGTLCCALGSSYVPLLIARAVTGAFGGVLNSLVLAIVGDKIPHERRGAAMGVIMTAFSVASIVGVPTGLFLATTFSWQAPFITLGVFSLLVSVPVHLFIPPVKEHLWQVRSESKFAPFRRVVADPNQTRAVILIFCLMLAGFTVIPFLSPSMVLNGGLAESRLSLIYLVGGGVSIVSGPLIGRLADRFGTRRIFQTMAALSIFPILIVTNLGSTPEWGMLLLAATLFICLSGRMIPAQALITSTVSPQFRGGFMSIVSGVQQSGAALGSYIAGLMIERSPSGELLYYSHVGLVSVACAVLAIVVAAGIKPLREAPSSAQQDGAGA
jgi:predicted MFS family arabinose efflux permease